MIVTAQFPRQSGHGGLLHEAVTATGVGEKGEKKARTRNQLQQLLNR